MTPCPECGLSMLHLDRCSKKPKPPSWLCWDSENMEEEDAEEFRFYQPSLAAEAFADRHCSDDCDNYESYENGVEVTVKSESGVVEKYMVNGQQTWSFYARKLS